MLSEACIRADSVVLNAASGSSETSANCRTVDQMRGVSTLPPWLTSLLITMAVVLGTAGLEVWLKYSTRPLTREDAIFWPTWIAAACVTLAGAVIDGLARQLHVPVIQAILAFIAVAFGFGFMPKILEKNAYDGTPQMKNWWWILGSNAMAVIILLSAVTVGVKIYDWA